MRTADMVGAPDGINPSHVRVPAGPDRPAPLYVCTSRDGGEWRHFTHHRTDGEREVYRYAGRCLDQHPDSPPADLNWDCSAEIAARDSAKESTR